MADRTIKLRRLIKILGSYDVEWDPSAGKGSHGVFRKVIGGAMITYPVPTSHDDVLVCYVRACRKRFRLASSDGVTDREFYDRG